MIIVDKEKWRALVAKLTPSEIETLVSILTGEDPTKFCERHTISRKTYDTHRMHVKQKMGLRGMASRFPVLALIALCGDVVIEQ